GRAPVGQVLVPDDMPRSACSALDWRESVPTLYRSIADAVKDMSGQRASGVFAAVRMDRRARCSDVDPEDVVLAGGFDACTGMGHGAMPMGCGNSPGVGVGTETLVTELRQLPLQLFQARM